MKILIAIGGHTGTGKTTLAYKLKKECPFLQESIIIEDDAVRRDILKIGLNKRLSDEDYSEEISGQVTKEIEKRTSHALSSKNPVINSSGFFSETTQKGVECMADAAGAKFVGLWLNASFDEMRKRIRKRVEERSDNKDLSLEKGHASDADEGVIDKFGNLPTPSSLWHVINANISEEELLHVALETIQKDMAS